MTAEMDPGAGLRVALRANAAFSTLSAIGLVVFAGPLARFAELPAWLVLALGIGLVAFAVFVGLAARRRLLDPTQIRAITIADLAWVAGAALVIALPGTMTVGGKWLLAAISSAVLILGLLEVAGLRRVAGEATVPVRADTARSA